MVSYPIPPHDMFSDGHNNMTTVLLSADVTSTMYMYIHHSPVLIIYPGLQVNGLSNLFWGWGREDDELYVRMKEAGMIVCISLSLSLSLSLSTFAYIVVFIMLVLLLHHLRCNIHRVSRQVTKHLSIFTTRPSGLGTRNDTTTSGR